MSSCPVSDPNLYVLERALLTKIGTVLETELRPTTNEKQGKTPNAETEAVADDPVIAEASGTDGLENKSEANLQKFEQLCRTVEDLARSENLRLVGGEKNLRAVKRAIDEVSNKDSELSLPNKRSRESLLKRLRRAHTSLLRRVRELRDFSDWQRWANLGVQENLCARLESLSCLSDDADVSKQLKSIMSQWRQVSDVPRDQGEPLRKRFQVAYDSVFPRCQAYEIARQKEREINLNLRVELIQKAEALMMSTDWLRTIKKMTELQAQWKVIGPVPYQDQRETWSRFREACNTFFSRRKEDLAKRKKDLRGNLKRKEELCLKVEELSDSPDVVGAVKVVKKIQAEWRVVGAVQRKQHEALLRRFQVGCDLIYKRAHDLEASSVAKEVVELEKLCEAAEGLFSSNAHVETSKDLAKKVQELRYQWRQTAQSQLVRRSDVTKRFEQAIIKAVERYPEMFRGTKLDPVLQAKKLKDLCTRVNLLLENDTPESTESHFSPAELLAANWREALATNTMGAKSDSDSKKRSVMKELKKLQDERKQIGFLVGSECRKLSLVFEKSCNQVLRASKFKNKQGQ